jgi:hypothetical protein
VQATESELRAVDDALEEQVLELLFQRPDLHHPVESCDGIRPDCLAPLL